MIKYLEKHYQMPDIKDHTEIEKVFSYWGLNPLIFSTESNLNLLADQDFFYRFIKLYEKELQELAKSSVSQFDLNFFSKESFPNKEKILSLAKSGSDLTT